MTSNYGLYLAAIDIWREARSEPIESKRAVAWVIRNRVRHPGWWGRTVAEVVTHKFQFSSMSAPGDPNLTQWPQEGDPSFDESLLVARTVLSHLDVDLDDPTDGAVFYFGPPLHDPPVAWGNVEWTLDCGNLHFYRHSQF